MHRRSLNKWMVLAALTLVLAACSQIGTGGVITAPDTGDSASDPSSASQFLPTLGGYITVADAGSISDVLTAVGAPASLISGNPVGAALFAQLDGMIGCYQNVGAIAARVYVQADFQALRQGEIPRVGAMAVINQDRIVNNFVPCALGNAPRAQDAIQPCSNSGSFVVNGETLFYVYGATQPDLCAQFQAAIPN